MSQVTLPLPNRSLSVVQRPFAMPAGFAFALVVLLALGIGLTWWQAPGLVRDWQINQDPLTLQDWNLLDGECSSRRGLTDCEAHVTYSYEGQDFDNYISLAFLDFTSGDYEVDLVIARDKPELATLSLGLDMLWNRTAVLLVFLLLFFGGAITTIIGAWRTALANRAAANPGRLTLVPVKVGDMRTVRGRPVVSYTDMRRVARTQFEKGQVPLIGLDETGTPVGVAVRLDNAYLPILLDSRLERIELTDIERETALAAFDAEQEKRGALASDNPLPAKRRGGSILRGLMAGGAVLLLAAIGFFAFWLYYVTTAPDAFDPIGIEINNIMPEPLNTWGCERLYERFGDDRAPFGCTADDYVSWRVAPGKTKVK